MNVNRKMIAMIATKVIMKYFFLLEQLLLVLLYRRQPRISSSAFSTSCPPNAQNLLKLALLFHSAVSTFHLLLLLGIAVNSSNRAMSKY